MTKQELEAQNEQLIALLSGVLDQINELFDELGITPDVKGGSYEALHSFGAGSDGERQYVHRLKLPRLFLFADRRHQRQRYSRS